MQQQKIQHTWRDKANEETRYIFSEFSKGMWSTSKEKQASLNNKIEKGLVSSSAVKSTSCSCRELHLGSLHSHNSSWLSELLLLGLLMPSSVVLKHCMPVVHIDTHRQNINVHKVKISNFFFFYKKRKTQRQLHRANMTLVVFGNKTNCPLKALCSIPISALIVPAHTKDKY